MIATDDDEYDTKPVEIHISKKWLKAGLVGYGLVLALLSILSVFMIAKTLGNFREIGWTAFFVYLNGWIAVECYHKLSFLRSYGPAFSFSKHGFIDHRKYRSKIYRWDEIDYVSWTHHRTSKGGPYELLRVNPLRLTFRQKISKLLLNHPFEINLSQMDDALKDPEKRVEAAVPRSKFRTFL